MPRFTSRGARGRVAVGVAAAMLVLASQSPAWAGKKKASCNTAANVTKDIWKYAGPILKQVLDKSGPQAATAAQIIRATEAGIKAWNKLAGNSWARIGPRRLHFGETHRGKVIGVTSRMFASPMVAFGPTKITVKKVKGKGRVRVVVCQVGQGNRFKPVTDFYLDRDTRDGTVKTVNIPDAAGKLIKVVIHGKKVGTVGIKYELRATSRKED